MSRQGVKRQEGEGGDLNLSTKKNPLHGVYTHYSFIDDECSFALLIGPISPAADGPLYQQIADGVGRAVSEGKLKPGAALPSFRALAVDLLVSLITVKRAYEELERDGIIFRRQGLGTFVADQGDSASREAKTNAARQHFENGAREAAEAGLSQRKIQSLASEAIKKINQDRK